MTDRHRSEKTGKFLGAPYDWRRPSWARLKSRVWNAGDDRVFTPRNFGWGWSINFREIAARLHFVKRA